MDPIAAYFTRIVADEFARSALPDAPVRPDPPKRRKRRWLRRR
jgi:hypothetical protein